MEHWRLALLSCLSTVLLSACTESPTSASAHTDATKTAAVPDNGGTGTRSSVNRSPKRTYESSVLVRKSGANGGIVWAPPKARRVDYPTEGVALGQGWDSFQDRKTAAQCIQFSQESVGGQVARTEVRKISESDSLRRAMSVSYSASAKAQFGAGGGEASAKAEFASSAGINRSYLSLLVTGSAQNGVAYVSPAKTPNGVVELTSYSRDLLKDRDRFLRTCGDSFVAAIERGAELYALYQFSSQEKTDSGKTAKSISVSGNYMGFSGSASTSSQSTKDVASKNELTGLKYLHSAHRGLRLPFNEESINGSLAALGSAPELSDSQPYRVLLVRYDSLPEWDGEPLRSGAVTRETLVGIYYRLSDLREIAIDVERNPQNYALEFAPDVLARGAILEILNRRLTELEALLSGCEKTKLQATDEASRTSIIDSCAARDEDLIFSDYPYRSVMPLSRDRVNAHFAVSQRDELQKRISALEEKYRNEGISYGGTLLAKCPNVPHLAACRSIKNQINSLKAQLSLVTSAHAYKDVAESRYRFWIEETSQARQDDGLFDALTIPAELAMYRREIFCQYGVSADTLPCPTTPLLDMILAGNVIKRNVTSVLDVSSSKYADPQMAWEDLQRRIAESAAKMAEGRPHHFQLINPKYENQTTAPVGGATTYKVTGDISVSYFSEDDGTAAALLTPP
jgi:hypothetical protein